MTITALPSQKFRVHKENDVFKFEENRINNELIKQKLSSKVAQIAWNIFSIIVLPIGIGRFLNGVIKEILSNQILPAQQMFDLELHKKLENGKRGGVVDDILGFDSYRDNFFAEPANHAEQITIGTADGIDLDAAEIQHPSQKALPADQQKWVVFFQGNAACYEQRLPEFKSFSDATGANTLSGNYRGVMRSKDRPLSPNSSKNLKPDPLTFQSLFLDGEAMVQYLLSKGVQPKNILVHGWSLGGAVATEIAARHQESGQEMNLCVDRSFSSMGAVVKSLFSFPLGWLFSKVITGAGWDTDSVSNYQKVKGGKFIITAKEDSIIPYAASLYKGIKEKQMTSKDRDLKKRRAQKGPAQPKLPQRYKPKNIKISAADLYPELSRKQIIDQCGKMLHCGNTTNQGPMFEATREILMLPPVKPVGNEPYAITKVFLGIFNSIKSIL